MLDTIVPPKAKTEEFLGVKNSYELQQASRSRYTNYMIKIYDLYVSRD